MTKLEALQGELNRARQAQADAEFCRDLAGKINAKISKATAGADFNRLKLLDVYICKAIELVGVPEDE